jgi:very-short-patch-repair endonuclease
MMRRAGELRKEPSPAEGKLWAFLRTLREDGIRFRRQYAIGPYIADFCTPRLKLIIEVDGSQHIEQQEYDFSRTRFLETKGFRVIRFWNAEVMNQFEDVKGVIWEAIGKEKE